MQPLSSMKASMACRSCPWNLQQPARPAATWTSRGCEGGANQWRVRCSWPGMVVPKMAPAGARWLGQTSKTTCALVPCSMWCTQDLAALRRSYAEQPCISSLQAFTSASTWAGGRHLECEGADAAGQASLSIWGAQECGLAREADPGGCAWGSLQARHHMAVHAAQMRQARQRLAFQRQHSRGHANDTCNSRTGECLGTPRRQTKTEGPLLQDWVPTLTHHCMYQAGRAQTSAAS